MWVLRTAKKCGITVPKKRIHEGIRFIVECSLPDGVFKYRTRGLHAEPQVGGACMIALFSDGRQDHELIPPARRALAYRFERYPVADLISGEFFVCGTFYASVAMYACGETYWAPWYRKVIECYKALQKADGELMDGGGNSIYPTAMAAAVMLAPKGYLPLYER
jgi:hypothetical protein